MKTLKKIILIGSALFMFPLVAWASETLLFYETELAYTSHIEGSEEWNYYNRMTIENQTAYSLDCSKTMREVVALKDTEYLKTMKPEELDFLRKVIYYGYGYEDRTDMEWYMAAQELICERMTDDQVYWKKELSDVVDVEEYKQQILKDIGSEELRPSVPKQVEGNYQQEIKIEDPNHVLHQYEVQNTTKNEATIEGDLLKIKINELQNGKIQLVHKYKRGGMDATFEPWHSPRYIILAMEPDIIDIAIHRTGTITGKVNIQFTEKDQEAKGIIRFKVKTKDGEYLQKKKIFATNEHGKAEIELTSGEYALELVEVPNAYIIDQTTMNFHVSEEDLINSKSIVKQELSRFQSKVTITRSGMNYRMDQTKIANISYRLYAQENILNNDGSICYHQNQEISLIKTNNQGNAIVENLPIGSYYLQEIENDTYLPYLEKIFFTISKENLEFKKEIVTKHIPLKVNIQAEGQNKYNFYFLYDEKDEQIANFSINQFQTIALEYGKYTLKVERNHKIIAQIPITFTKENDTLYKNFTDEVIDFEMPKTSDTTTPKERNMKLSFLIGIFFLALSFLPYLKNDKR